MALHAELTNGATDGEVLSALVRALWLRGLDGRVDVRSFDAGLLRATQEVVEHPEAITGVSELARRCGLSRSRFHACFVACFGLPPGKWLRQVRMRHARDLLQSTGLSVATVAARLGYASEAAFRKAYRQTLGIAARAGHRGP